MARHPALLLEQTVRSIHQETVLETLQSHNYQLTTWDPEAAGQAMDAISEAAIEASDDRVPIPIWSSVDLDEGWDPRKSIEKPIYPVRILGSAGISLVAIHNLVYENLTADRKLIASQDEVDTRTHMIDVVLHPERSRGSFSTTPDADSAVVFLAQDLYPMAVHREDLATVATEYGLPGMFKLSIIDKVQKHFGADSVEPLPPETCADLALALRHSEKSVHVA